MNFSFDLSQFDTDLFGFKVAKINSISTEDAVIDIIKKLRGEGVKYASYRIHANDFPIIHSLERNGFLLVDGLISLKGIIPQDNERSKSITDASLDQLDDLKSLAREVFSLNRFYNDPIIPKDKANELYAVWMENSLKGKAADKVLVYMDKGEVLGFLTLQKNGHIPLAGVSEKARGRGIAKKLITYSFDIFRNWGSSEVFIETQMGNIPALRAYLSCGFKIVDSHLTFRWVDESILNAS